MRGGGGGSYTEANQLHSYVKIKAQIFLQSKYYFHLNNEYKSLNRQPIHSLTGLVGSEAAVVC